MPNWSIVCGINEVIPTSVFCNIEKVTLCGNPIIIAKPIEDETATGTSSNVLVKSNPESFAPAFRIIWGGD